MAAALEELSIWHIYAHNPDYRPFPAGGEGCSCVDDVARIVVFYLRQYRSDRDRSCLEKARAGLEFILRMQEEDGEFYNFVRPDGSINRDGITSYKSLGWWAARAVWAMGTAFALFRSEEPEFAALVSARLGITLERILDYLAEHAGEYRSVHGVMVPAWFPDNSADAAATAALGLCGFYEATGDERAETIIRRYCAGFVEMQHGTPEEFPFQAFLNDPDGINRWHAWGHRQVAALACAGALLGERGWVTCAERAANSIYARLVASWGPILGMFPVPRLFEQIAYSMEVIAGGFFALYRATGKELYARLGGLTVSWLFGNNPAGAAVYDPETGRCLDGINGPEQVNLHSGAESTVCALLALSDMADVPLAHPYVELRADQFGLEQVMPAAGARPVAGAPQVLPPGAAEALPDSGALLLAAGDRARLRVRVPAAGDYVLHLVYERQTAPEALLALRLNEGRPHYHWQGGSPDDPYPTMGHVAVFEELAAGEHLLDLEGILGPVRIYAALLHPAVLAKTLSTAAGQGSAPARPALARALGRGERRVLLLKNLRGRPAYVPIAAAARATILTYDGAANPVTDASAPMEDGSRKVYVPPFGVTLVEE